MFFYIHELINSLSLEIEPAKKRVEKAKNGLRSFDNYTDINQWIPIFEAAIQFLKNAEKNWIGTYKILPAALPLKYRKGIVPASVVAHFYPEFRHLQVGLGIRDTKKMLSIIEQGKLRSYEAGIVEKMTANDFFEYCKLGYIAVGKAKKDEPAKELYKRFADGRHEGLLDIDATSEKEFADWIDGTHPKKNIGGHPWEILRGGNTSNIQLRVSRHQSFNKKEYKIEVYATGLSRLVESIKIFLAIYKAGKIITIQEPNTIRDQLLLLDNIGILPENNSLHRGIQLFEEHENVNHVIHLYDLRKHLSKINPFITWEPLPIMPIKSI